MIILIAIAVFVATLLGGLFALRFRDRLHLIVGFSAGAVVGIVFFDLMPEAIDLSRNLDPSTVLAIMATGFAGYLILDRFVILHSHHDDHVHERRGILGAGSLSVHSFLDGLAIGVAFQVSQGVGIVVAIAVLAHDFSDGINTVNLILKNHGNRKLAFRFLLMDALAPVLGIVSTRFMMLSEDVLGIMLAVFSGFFLYIGASDLIPESHHDHPTVATTVMTLLGMAMMFVVVRAAGAS